LKHRKQESQSPYGGVERQLLNTFFSGVYISSKDFLIIGRKLEMEGLALKGRELLLKEIIARAETEGKVSNLVSEFLQIISKRVEEYRKLLEAYPHSTAVISQLMQKANATKMLIQNMLRANPYG
jgi:hypothetical protein